MDSTSKRANPWPAAIAMIALASTYFFFQEVIDPDWKAWVIAPALVSAFYVGVAAAPKDSVARSVLINAALLLVPFMAFYSIADDLSSADWPELAAAPILALLFWLWLLLPFEDDD